MKRFTVVVQKWEESEIGWGSRPDGFSLHLNYDHRNEYIQKYWNSMPKSLPSEYSRPDGAHYTAKVSEKIFEEIKLSKNGIRKDGKPPGAGGIDGWRSVVK